LEKIEKFRVKIDQICEKKISGKMQKAQEKNLGKKCRSRLLGIFERLPHGDGPGRPQLPTL